MPRKQSNTEKLMALSGNTMPANANPPPSGFIQKMVYCPDAKQAAVMVRDYAHNQFMQGDGAELEELNTLKSDTDAQYEQSEKTLSELQNAQSKTPRYIKYRELTASPDDPKSSGKRKLPWELFDIILTVVLAVCATFIMGMSGANVYANLMESGATVFIEQPWLAFCISALAPCASASFKMLSSFFEYQSTKKKYALAIHILTLIVTVAWTVAFALNFSGVSGGIDIDTMLDGDGGKGSALVWLQLVCEILVGASLFLALGEIALKYSPFILTENPDHLNISKALKAHKETHEKLCEKAADLAKRITRLESQREVYINDCQAEFNARVFKLNSLNQL